MKIFIKNKFLSRVFYLVIIIILFGIFSTCVFIFEYKGLNNVVREKYPQLGFLYNLPKILDIFYLPYKLTSSSLPAYNLIVDLKDLKELEKSLSENPSDILSGEYRESIPAEFVYNNQTYSVKIRVRGDFSEHWKYKKKSWRIIFDNSNLFEGKKEISLIIPIERGFIAEHLSNYRASKLSLIFPESRFIVLKINNHQPAVYFEVESWTKEFLEKNKWSDQSDLYGENDTLAFQGYLHDLLENPAYWKKYTKNKQDQIDNFAAIDLLGKLVHESSDQEFYRQIPALVDMDSFYRWQVHSSLMGSTNQEFAHNVRLCFDVSQGKFKFIPWDVRIYDRDKFVDFHYNSLVSKILKNPEFLHERNKLLWDYVKDDKNLEDDLNFYNQTYKSVKNAFYNDGIKGFSNLYFDRKILNKKNLIIQQYRNVQNTLESNQVLATVNIFPQTVRIDITTRGFSDIILHLTEDFQMHSQREIPQGYLFKEEIKILPVEYSFFLKKSDFNSDDFKLDITNAVTGEPIEVMIRYVDEETFSYFEQINYSRDQFLENNSIFRKGILDNQVVLYPGVYQIDKTIIFPRNLSLEIKPDVQLKFALDVSFISYGSILAQGSKERPIRLFGQNKDLPWGVFAILGPHQKKSVFEYCLIEGGSEAYINGVFYSGQLAVHHTDVIIKDCQFQLANGDDGLNIKNGKVEIKNNIFSNNKFDGLDLDWVTGAVSNNYFSDNGQKTVIDGDGLDLSGSANLMIFNNKFKNSPDKCLSVGEDSKDTTIIFNNLFSGCDIGIAVKDNSKVKIINNVIVDNRIGISVYEKKPVFGGAWPVVINTIIWNNDKSIELDGKSNITISHSNIQNGYENENNFDQEPIFQDSEQDNFLLLDNQHNLALTNSGYVEIVNTILNKQLEVVSIGLFNLFSEFYD
ncbi:CotH kinase family protein [Patescibacteria group bacterium]|nr:CotH kinase family protein [Patescibacteria group bacterium]